METLAVLMGPTGATGAADAIFKADFVGQSTWLLNHNLGREIQAQVYSVGGLSLITEVERTSINQLTARFDLPTSGYILYS